MIKLNCIAIDDEPLALKIINKYAEKIPQLNLIESCPDAVAGMSVLKNNEIDLIFLDINMPKLSGVTFFKSLRNPPMVIFTTAYPEYAIEGFELEAIDYLLKPFSFARFNTAFEKALEQKKLMQSNELKTVNHIFIKSEKKLFKVEFNDILYLEAYGDYVKVHTTQKMLLTKRKLGNVLKELPSDQFVLSHRSYIVSIRHIEFLEGNQIEIKENKIPISAGQREVVLKALNRK